MKKVLFVLLCVAAVAIVPACKKGCEKEKAPTVAQTEQTAPAAPVAEAPAAPAPVAAPTGK